MTYCDDSGRVAVPHGGTVFAPGSAAPVIQVDRSPDAR